MKGIDIDVCQKCGMSDVIQRCNCDKDSRRVCYKCHDKDFHK